MALEHRVHIKAALMKICSSNEYIMSKNKIQRAQDNVEEMLRKFGKNNLMNQMLALLNQATNLAMLCLHAKAFHTLNWKSVRFADAIATSRNEGLHHLDFFQPLWRHFVRVSRKDN